MSAQNSSVNRPLSVGQKVLIDVGIGESHFVVKAKITTVFPNNNPSLPPNTYEVVVLEITEQGANAKIKVADIIEVRPEFIYVDFDE